VSDPGSNTLSYTVRLPMRVRQGSVLSPSLFSVYVDGMLGKLNNSILGCHIKSRCYNAIMYADDLLLISITISDLQSMINLCVSELCADDLSINALCWSPSQLYNL